jgi:cytochrome c oxidase subunit 2
MKRPFLTLALLAIAGGAVAIRLPAQQESPQVVAISAKRFEFTPSEISLERGKQVTLRVSAVDRSHGLFQKDLNLALDLTPDRVAEASITPVEPGRYVAICDHFCGSGHGNMKLVINVK